MGHTKLLRSTLLSRGCLLRVQMDRAGVRADTRSTLTNACILKGTFFPKVVCVAADEEGGKSRQTRTPLQKQTWTLKSDIISRVIYLQLTVPPLLEKERTDVSLVLMKETTNRRWGSIVWGEVLYDDIMHTYCLRIYTYSMNLFFK